MELTLPKAVFLEKFIMLLLIRKLFKYQMMRVLYILIFRDYILKWLQKRWFILKKNKKISSGRNVRRMTLWDMTKECIQSMMKIQIA
jgi:hypothetical protein